MAGLRLPLVAACLFQHRPKYESTRFYSRCFDLERANTIVPETISNTCTIYNIFRDQGIGERCFDEGMYEAARLLFKNIHNNAKLALCLVHLGQYREAVEAATKANAVNTWKQVTCFVRSTHGTKFLYCYDLPSLFCQFFFFTIVGFVTILWCWFCQVLSVFFYFTIVGFVTILGCWYFISKCCFVLFFSTILFSVVFFRLPIMLAYHACLLCLFACYLFFVCG